MKKLVHSAYAVAALLGLMVVCQTAQARPGYHKAFLAKYPALEAAAKEAKCNVCHMGDDKKMRNDYGAAMGKHLPGKNCKDEAAITAALTKAEDDKNSSGKTYGEIIKSGKLPASN